MGAQRPEPDWRRCDACGACYDVTQPGELDAWRSHECPVQQAVQAALAADLESAYRDACGPSLGLVWVDEFVLEPPNRRLPLELYDALGVDVLPWQRALLDSPEGQLVHRREAPARAMYEQQRQWMDELHHLVAADLAQVLMYGSSWRERLRVREAEETAALERAYAAASAPDLLEPPHLFPGVLSCGG